VLRRIVTSAHPDDRSRASAAVPAIQMVGYGLGAALAGLFANMSGFADGIDPAETETVGFWIFAGFIPVLLIGWVTILGLSKAEISR